ncbi:MAG: heparinase II/III domain-containing protein, partial [Rhodobacterales bacterium]
GGLVHFHGGGRGIPGRLDQALSEVSIRLPARMGGAMGYHRISNNGTILIMDGGAQIPKNEPSFSALSFELSIGHEELIVNTGPGMLFGSHWLNSSRTLYAHSGVCVDETVPSVGRTDVVPKFERKESSDVVKLNSSHDGFALTHGVLHYRKIEMNRKGSVISGKDTILAEGVSHCGIFDGWLKRKNTKSMPFNARFHISPDVTLEFGILDTAVSMTTPKGDVWILRSPNAKISIQESAFMQYGHLHPRASKQVVVSGSAMDYEGVIEWTLSRLEVLDH